MAILDILDIRMDILDIPMSNESSNIQELTGMINSGHPGHPPHILGPFGRWSEQEWIGMTGMTNYRHIWTYLLIPDTSDQSWG